MMKKVFQEHGLFFLILMACAVLRLWPLFDYQFTYDELSAFQRIGYDSLGELIREGIRIDAHPALLQVFIHYTAKLLGNATWIFKLPFLIMSLGTISFLYFTGVRFYNKQSGLAMAVWSGFSLVFVYYAPIVRMYGSGMFFSAALIYYYHHLLEGSRKRSHFVGIGLFALLSALNHHMNALFAASLMFVCFFQLPAASRKLFLITCLSVVAFYAPHLPITFYQLGLGGIGYEQGGWLDKPKWDAGLQFIAILFGTARYWILVVILMLVSIFQKGLKIKKANVTLLFLFIVNYLIIIGYSHFRAPIYQHSVMLFSGMGLLVALLSQINYRLPRQFYFMLLGCMFILGMQTYNTKNYLGEAVKTVYEYQFQALNKYGDLVGPNQVGAIFMDTDTLIGRVYARYSPNKFMVKYNHTPEATSMKGLSDFLKNSASECMILSSANPGQLALLKAYFPYIVENTQTQAINLVVGFKRPVGQHLNDEVNKPVYSHDLLQPGDFKFSFKSLPLALNQIEFPCEVSIPYHDAYISEGNMLLVTAKFKNTDPQVNVVMSAVEQPSLSTYSSVDVGSFMSNNDSTVTVFAQHYAGTSHHKISDPTLLKIYLWNQYKGNGTLLDLKLELIDWTPKKWHWWD